MAERLKAAVLKTASREPGRGFESYSLRQPSLKLRLASHALLKKTLSACRHAHSVKKWRDAREAEGARLLSEYPAYNGIEGSNPSLSAITIVM